MSCLLHFDSEKGKQVCSCKKCIFQALTIDQLQNKELVKMMCIDEVNNITLSQY